MAGAAGDCGWDATESRINYLFLGKTLMNFAIPESLLARSGESAGAGVTLLEADLASNHPGLTRTGEELLWVKFDMGRNCRG